jgi:hypothetical protein
MTSAGTSSLRLNHICGEQLASCVVSFGREPDEDIMKIVFFSVRSINPSRNYVGGRNRSALQTSGDAAILVIASQFKPLQS